MNRRNVVMGLATTPLLTYGIPPEEMPQSPPEPDDYEVQIYFQTWPLDAKVPKGRRCFGWDTVKGFLEHTQPVLTALYGQVYWTYTAVGKTKEIKHEYWDDVVNYNKRCDRCFRPHEII